MENNELNFPYEMIEVDPKTLAKLKKHFTAPSSGYLLVGPQKYFFSYGYKQEGPKMYNMKVRPTDTFVVTFPKSGTTWTQELVWLLKNDFDYETARAKTLSERFPFLDGTFFFQDENLESNVTKKMGTDKRVLKFLDFLKTAPREMLDKVPEGVPRFVKSHLPLSLLPPALLDTAKVVYVARDPRDVAVSFYYHNKLWKLAGFEGEFTEFWPFFMNGTTEWSPYFAHVKEVWAKRNHPNMLFLFYEELIKDLPACIRRVAEFLGRSVSEEQMVRLCDHLSFENFKNNKSVNFDELRELGALSDGVTFMRKGKSGGWRAHFDHEMSAQAQDWIEDNLRGTDLRFPTVD